MPKFAPYLVLMILLASPLTSTACSSGSMQGSSGLGNSGGSQPVNEKEGMEMNKALLRCHKTGGSRVVKIEGKFKCY